MFVQRLDVRLANQIRSRGVGHIDLAERSSIVMDALSTAADVPW